MWPRRSSAVSVAPSRSNWLSLSAATVRSNAVGALETAMSDVPFLMSSRPPQAVSATANNASSSAFDHRETFKLNIVTSSSFERRTNAVQRREFLHSGLGQGYPKLALVF